MTMIQTFGQAAVHGSRRLGVGEMRRMNLANRVRLAYAGRAAYRNADNQADWAEWAEHNKDAAELLAFAVREAHD